MSHDILGEAARALREQTSDPGDAGRAAETRAQVLGASRARGVRKLFLVKTTVLLAAALLVASTAWGTPAVRASLRALAASLGVGPRAEVAAAPAKAAEEAPDEPVTTAVAQVDEAPIAPAPVLAEPRALAVPAAPVEARTARPSGRQAAKVAATAESPAPPPVTEAPAAPVASAPAADADHDLYVVAHRLHFTDHNPAAALAAWDAYLRGAPGGRFASEAYYNRALCLVRLGRVTEARRALEPFARGGFGGYRQAEAKVLLEAMPSARP